MAMRDTPESRQPHQRTEDQGMGTRPENTAGYTGGPRSDGTDHGGHDQDSPANRLMGAARERARSAFQEQQMRAADQLGSMANALHRAATELNDQNQGPVAKLADTAAARVERFADTLRHRDADDILAQVEGFARRQPEMFIGGAFAVGFLLARFVKSSGERRALRSGHQSAHGGHYRSDHSTSGSRHRSEYRDDMGRSGRSGRSGRDTASHTASGVQGSRETGEFRGYGAYTGGYAGPDPRGYGTGDRPDLADAIPNATGGVTATSTVGGGATGSTAGSPAATLGTAGGAAGLAAHSKDADAAASRSTQREAEKATNWRRT